MSLVVFVTASVDEKDLQDYLNLKGQVPGVGAAS